MVEKGSEAYKKDVIAQLKAATDLGLYQNDEIRPDMQNLMDEAETIGISPSVTKQIISGLSGKYDLGNGQIFVVTLPSLNP